MTVDAFELYGPAQDKPSKYTLQVTWDYVQVATRWVNTVRARKGEQPLEFSSLFIDEELEILGRKVHIGSFRGGDNKGITGHMDARVLTDLENAFARAAGEILDLAANKGPAVFIPALREFMEARRDYISTAKLTFPLA